MSTTAIGAIVSDDDPGPLQHPRARAPAQPWSLQEDVLLRAAVAKCEQRFLSTCFIVISPFPDGEDTDSWKRIADDVPGRTNKSCRKVNTPIIALRNRTECASHKAMEAFAQSYSQEDCLDEGGR